MRSHVLGAMTQIEIYSRSPQPSRISRQGHDSTSTTLEGSRIGARIVAVTMITIFVAMSPAFGATAIATSSNGFWGVATDQSTNIDAVSKKAIQSCLQRGGVNPRIVVVTRDDGSHGAVAKSGAGSQAVFGCAAGIGPGPMAHGYSDKEYQKEAEARAIADCKRRGGTNPQTVETW